jgi:hypothetical protein
MGARRAGSAMARRRSYDLVVWGVGFGAGVGVAAVLVVAVQFAHVPVQEAPEIGDGFGVVVLYFGA